MVMLAFPTHQLLIYSESQGNTAFKAGDYYSAIGHYTAAIIADPNNSTFPLNRAATYLKLDKSVFLPFGCPNYDNFDERTRFVDAERDCTTVLRLSSSSTKGWFRRGQARLGLGDYAQAQSGLPISAVWNGSLSIVARFSAGSAAGRAKRGGATRTEEN